MENQQSNEPPTGTGAGLVEDPDHQVCADENSSLAATLEAGSGSGSWYWTSMLNFSQSGSSSTHTSAGQLASSQFAGSPASSSSVHINTNTCSNGNNTSNNCQQLDHTQLPIETMIPSTTTNSDPEHAVWGQEFLSGSIGETKASMHACADDGLQELLYPRSVRELLLDQTPSWEILQQTAGISSKGFAFPLGQDDNMETMHGLGPDMKPSSQLPTLPYTHDDRLSSSTASSTLTDGTQLSGVEQWPVAHSEPIQARSSSMRVSHTSILRQFDPARVKQEYASPLSGATSFHHPGNKPTMSSFLLQQQPHHHNMRIINPSHEQAALLNEANIGTNPDIKPCKQLSSWQGSVVVGPIADDQCRPSPSFELSNLPANMSGDTHQMLLNSLKQHQNHLDSAAFAGTPHLRAQESTFLHQDHQQRHQIMQQAGIHMHHPLANSILNASIGMHQFPSGLKKTRAHTERLGANQSGLLSSMEEVDIKGRDQKSAVPPHEDYNLKRPRIDSAGHQQPPGQVQQTAAASSPSFKSQPPRKEKLADRITTLQQLVSPFGKTDTASVLLEAIGYIKFLQEQVQTLSSPYLKSTNIQTAHNGEKNPNGEEAKPDLRSKGLCLVPLSCTMQVANDNAADYWLGGTYR